MQVLAQWEEYSSIKEWKKGLKINSHKNKLSEKTVALMRSWMPLFLEYSQKNPDELIEESINSKETVRARLSDFCSWLQDVKGKKYNGSVHASYSIIRGFYSHNNVNTQKIRMPKMQPAQVQFSDDNLSLFDIITTEKAGVQTEHKRIRRDFIKGYFSYLNPRDQIIGLCILSSGLDSGDILSIPLATIRYQDASQERIFIRDLRNKTGESVSTFFSKEASKLIRNYVKNHRKDGLDSEPVFVLGNKEFRTWFCKKNGRKFNQFTDETKVMPLEVASLSTNFRDAVNRYNQSNSEKIPIEKSKQSPLRPKRFRKVFNDACDAAGIPTDIKRVFMGKSDPANKVYEGKSRQDLEIYYKKVESNLTIFSDYADSKSEDISKLYAVITKQEEKLNKQGNELSNIDEINNFQKDEIERLSQAVKYLMEKEKIKQIEN